MSELYLYAPGAQLYERVADQYGYAAANRIAEAAATGDQWRVNAVFAEIRQNAGAYQPDRTGRTDSTLGNFWSQMTTDPLDAPLASANNQIGKAVWNVVKNPWVLLTLAGVVFYLVGGFDWLKKKLT